jgi:hypothetical protein
MKASLKVLLKKNGDQTEYPPLPKKNGRIAPTLSSSKSYNSAAARNQKNISTIHVH